MKRYLINIAIILYLVCFNYHLSGGGLTARKEKLSVQEKKIVRAINRKKMAIAKVYESLDQGKIRYDQLPDTFFCLKAKIRVFERYAEINAFMWFLFQYNHERDKDLLANFLSDSRTPLNIVEDRHTPLLISIIKGHHQSDYKLAIRLIQNGADPNLLSTINEWSPLLEALKVTASSKNIECIKVLLDRGANIHHQEAQFGYNALHILSRMGGTEQSKILSLLIDYGADPHALNNLEQNALLVAAAFLSQHKNIAYLYFLASKTKNLTHQDKKGRSLYDYIKHIRNPQLQPLLKQAFDAHWQIKQVFNEIDCPICLESLDQGVVMLKCGHKFHCNCLAQWNKLSCPLCRAAW